MCVGGGGGGVFIINSGKKRKNCIYIKVCPAIKFSPLPPKNIGLCRMYNVYIERGHLRRSKYLPLQV